MEALEPALCSEVSMVFKEFTCFVVCKQSRFVWDFGWWPTDVFWLALNFSNIGYFINLQCHMLFGSPTDCQLFPHHPIRLPENCCHSTFPGSKMARLESEDLLENSSWHIWFHFIAWNLSNVTIAGYKGDLESLLIYLGSSHLHIIWVQEKGGNGISEPPSWLLQGQIP